MSHDESDIAILLADISGSTPLYEAIGDAAAARQIGACLDRLRSIIARQGGVFFHSRGDDVLCIFAETSSALSAAREMLSQPPVDQPTIHAGMHFGPVIHAEDGAVFGDAVNLTARLAVLARPGEVLVSRSFIDHMPDAERWSMRMLDNMTLKGKSAPTEIYSLLAEDASSRTEATFARGSGHTRIRHAEVAPGLSVTLRYADRSRLCEEQHSLSIGRSADSDVVIARSWVSRRHALLTVQRGKVQLEDRSTLGTYVSVRGGYEFFMRRETVVLTGSGLISPAMRPADANAEVIHYEVVRHRCSEPQQRASSDGA